MGHTQTSPGTRDEETHTGTYVEIAGILALRFALYFVSDSNISNIYRAREISRENSRVIRVDP